MDNLHKELEKTQKTIKILQGEKERCPEGSPQKGELHFQLLDLINHRSNLIDKINAL